MSSKSSLLVNIKPFTPNTQTRTSSQRFTFTSSNQQQYPVTHYRYDEAGEEGDAGDAGEAEDRETLDNGLEEVYYPRNKRIKLEGKVNRVKKNVIKKRVSSTNFPVTTRSHRPTIASSYPSGFLSKHQTCSPVSITVVPNAVVYSAQAFQQHLPKRRYAPEPTFSFPSPPESPSSYINSSPSSSSSYLTLSNGYSIESSYSPYSEEEEEPQQAAISNLRSDPFLFCGSPSPFPSK